MLQMKNVDYCCENNLCRGGIELQGTVLNWGCKMEKQQQGENSTGSWVIMLTFEHYRGVRCKNVISEHLQKPVLLKWIHFRRHSDVCIPTMTH